MELWNILGLLGSIFRPWAVRLHELAAIGALLTCLAIVLNVGPLAGTLNRKAAQAATEPSLASGLPAPPQVDADARSGTPQSNTEATEISARFRPAPELSSIPDNEFARLVFQPVSPKDRDVEMQFGLTRQDRGTPGSVTRPLAAVVGVWAPDTGTCSARYFRDGMLPTIINADGAWAGETFCIFKSQKQTETGWKVVASCSNPREHWTTEVRLNVKDNRLIWTSKRGTQTYSRCAPDFLMAAAR